MNTSQKPKKRNVSRKTFLTYLAGGTLVLGANACGNLLPRPQKISTPEITNKPSDNGIYSLNRIRPLSKKLTAPQFLTIHQPSAQLGQPLALDSFESSLVYERLLTVDPRTAGLIGGAAITLEWIDANTINFLVRPNNFFHATDPNANDLLPVSNTMIAEDFRIKNNSRSYFWNEIIGSIHAVPDTRSPNGTVQLKLNGTYSHLLNDLSSVDGEIRSPYRYKNFSERSGSGPFKPILVQPDVHNLTRNIRSTAVGNSVLEQITYKKLDAEQWREPASSDSPGIWLNKEPSGLTTDLIKDIRFANSLWILGMRIPTANTEQVTPGNALLKDPRMRKAITHAVDSDVVAGYVNGLSATLIAGPYTADILSANQIASTRSLVFDRSLTAEYLGAIGYGGEPLRLLHLNLEPYISLMSILRSQLQAVGLVIEPVPISPQRLQETLTTTSFDLALLKIGPQPTPNQALRMYGTSNQRGDADNPWGFSSPVFDTIIEDAARTMLPAERSQLHVEAQKVLLDLAPAVLPLATESSSAWIDSRVRGYYHDAYDYNQTSLSLNWHIT